MFKSQTWLVAKNTFSQRAKGVGFWSIVLSPILMIAIFAGIIYLISLGNDNSKLNIAVVNNPALTKTLSSAQTMKGNYSELSKEEAQSQLEKGKIDAYLETDKGNYSLTSTEKSESKINKTQLEQVLKSVNMIETAQSLKLSQTDLANLLASPKLSMKTWSSSGEEKSHGNKKQANYYISLAVSVIIFGFIMMYAGQVAQEIGNEKSNRIMEILLAASSAKAQYYGKTIGVILIAITQVILYIIGIFIAYFFIKDIPMVKGYLDVLKDIDVSFVLYASVMTIVAIIAYTFLAASIASLINEQSQIQQAVMPLTLISMLAYLIATFGALASGNIVLKILSFVPFMSPSIMTSSYAIQKATLIEAMIALVLQLVVAVLIAKFGEKVYARNVLSYSDEKIFTQFFRNLRGDSI